MQATSLPDTAAIGVERSAVWRALFSAVRHVSNRSYVLLRDHLKLKWALAVLATFISFQSYFVRELLAALFFFTILYAIVAVLVALYLLICDALYSGILWVGSLGHSFYLFLRNHLAPPSQILSLPSGRASHGDQRFGCALTSAVTILLPSSSHRTSPAFESALREGGSPCSELHYLGGRKVKGDGK
jgi:hypothetical protein